MTEQTTAAAIEQRIARAQAATTPVDHNGTPTGKPTTYSYDAQGRLIDTEKSA